MTEDLPTDPRWSRFKLKSKKKKFFREAENPAVTARGTAVGLLTRVAAPVTAYVVTGKKIFSKSKFSKNIGRTTCSPGINYVRFATVRRVPKRFFDFYRFRSPVPERRYARILWERIAPKFSIYERGRVAGRPAGFSAETHSYDRNATGDADFDPYLGPGRVFGGTPFSGTRVPPAPARDRPYAVEPRRSDPLPRGAPQPASRAFLPVGPRRDYVYTRDDDSHYRFAPYTVQPDASEIPPRPAIVAAPGGRRGEASGRRTSRLVPASPTISAGDRYDTGESARYPHGDPRRRRPTGGDGVPSLRPRPLVNTHELLLYSSHEPRSVAPRVPRGPGGATVLGVGPSARGRTGARTRHARARPRTRALSGLFALPGGVVAARPPLPGRASSPWHVKTPEFPG